MKEQNVEASFDGSDVKPVTQRTDDMLQDQPARQSYWLTLTEVLLAGMAWNG